MKKRKKQRRKSPPERAKAVRLLNHIRAVNRLIKYSQKELKGSGVPLLAPMLLAPMLRALKAHLVVKAQAAVADWNKIVTAEEGEDGQMDRR